MVSSGMWDDTRLPEICTFPKQKMAGSPIVSAFRQLNANPKSLFTSVLQLDMQDFYILDELYYFRWWSPLGNSTHWSITTNYNCTVCPYSPFPSFSLPFLSPSLPSALLSFFCRTKLLQSFHVARQPKFCQNLLKMMMSALIFHVQKVVPRPSFVLSCHIDVW